MLNVLLAVIVIVISIALALSLPKIAFGMSGQENPFAIYQIAISLNYFSSFPGNFNITISYPGIEQCEFRIATFHRDESGIIDKGNSYVSEGFCNEVNHVQNLINAAISAALSSIPVEIPGLGNGVSAEKLIVGTVIEAGKMYLWSQLISFTATFIINLLSGNPIDMFSSFVESFSRQGLGYFAQVVANQGMEFAQLVFSLLITSVVRYVLGFTGIYGFAISFAINFAIAIAGDIYQWIRGITDVTYNCLHQGGVGVQYVYMEYNRVYYSQNLYIPLDLQNVEIGNTYLAKLTDGWLYKVSMVENVDSIIYVLSGVEIYTDNGEIEVNPIYSNVTEE